METLDTLGRRLATNDETTYEEISATECDLYLFERLDWHGILPTDFLCHFDRECGRLKTKNLKTRLKTLSSSINTPEGSQYLRRMKQAFPRNPGGFIPNNVHLVYKNKPAAEKALGSRFRNYKHGAKYEHQLMQACFTAELELGTYENREYQFIPQHRLTNKPLVFHVSFQFEGKHYEIDYKPDQLAGIDYGGPRRNFVIENDRGTEQKKQVFLHKKTVYRNLLQMHHFLKRVKGARSLYAQQLDTEINAFGLFECVNETQMMSYIDMVMEFTNGGGDPRICFRTDGRFEGQRYPAPFVSLQNYHGPWKRAGREDIYIDRP